MRYNKKQAPILEGPNDGKHRTKIPCSFGDRWRMLAAARKLTKTSMYEWVIAANHNKMLQHYRVSLHNPEHNMDFGGFPPFIEPTYSAFSSKPAPEPDWVKVKFPAPKVVKAYMKPKKKLIRSRNRVNK